MTSTKNLQESIQNGDKGSRMTNTKHNDQMMPAPSGQDQPPPPPSHQQDLIRLLAQHFNSQLYQMTATNNHRLPDVNSSNQLLHNFSNSAPGGALNFQSSSILSQYQQQHRQFRGLMNYGPTNTTNLLSHLDQQTGLANQISRSHHQTSSSSSSGPSSHHHHPHGQQHDTTLPMSNAANNPLACNSLFGDANMNLFNALNCFNVNSDQFLLSLQQQYLLQAASTVRQMESRQLISNNEDMNRIVETNSHGHGTRTIAGKGELAMGGGRSGVADLSSVENNNGKELLKFSINTILGRGSPAQNSTVNSDVKNNTNHASAMKNQYLIERAGGGAYLSRENEPANMTTPDCDQELNTTDIDSCSSLTTTPQPSVANQTNNPFGQLAGHQPSSSGSMNNQSVDLAIDMNKQHSSGHHQAPLSFLSGSSTFPWTVAARGKPRRGMMRRAVFSDSQRVGLEKRFQLQKYISKPDRKKLAEKLGLRDSQVKIWFQNRRMKWRNSKERELLSAGGSREQTLPTRNNPNPDLSDVGETIKRIVSGPNSIGAA